jgi:alkaline phosphatase
MEHTGSQVRLMAYGPDVERFRWPHDMTDVLVLIHQSLDLK